MMRAYLIVIFAGLVGIFLYNFFAALLRALLCPGAPALLFDEPFTGMDAALVSQASAAIRRLTAGRDAILVTHDAEAASSLGWPVVRMYPAEAGAP